MKDSLFPEKDITSTKEAGEVWKRWQVDVLAEMYLEGSSLERIALKLGKTWKSIRRKLDEYIYNERDRLINYKPVERTSRSGKRITANEKQMIDMCRQKDIPFQHLARFLRRPLTDLQPNGPKEIRGSGAPVPKSISLDYVLACRYAFHIYSGKQGHKVRIIPDSLYDTMKAEELEFGGGEEAFRVDPRHCPPYIKSLAVYLMEKEVEAERVKLLSNERVRTVPEE